MWPWPQLTLVVGHLLLLNLQIPNHRYQKLPSPPVQTTSRFKLCPWSGLGVCTQTEMRTANSSPSQSPSSSKEFIARLFSLVCKSQINSSPRINVAFKTYTEPHDCSDSLPQPSSSHKHLSLSSCPSHMLSPCFMPPLYLRHHPVRAILCPLPAHPQLLSNFFLSCCN